MIDRRSLLRSSLLGLAGSLFAFNPRRGAAAERPPARAPRRPGAGPHPAVVTPDGSTLPWTWDRGVKVFHLVAEPMKRQFAPGLTVNCWGYNGQAPGPTIEAVEGDRVRILVTNKLPEATSVHWHGVLVPNGMDGVSGLNQPTIAPGETFQYEFTLRQHGTQMYHPHFDEMTQIAQGMMGFFVIHPRDALAARVDRDFCIFLHEWAIKPGTATPDPTVMTDFNVFTFNGRVFPATTPLVARRGQRVRIRFANLSMDSHPMHLHGVHFRITGTDGGRIPDSAQWPESTVNVAAGTTRDIEFAADNPGDWALHCHKTHHTMNQMGHGLPLMLGVDTAGLDEKVQQLLPGYMAIGQAGMGEMMMMGAPRNSIPMLGGDGPSGAIDMGGMLTIVKVREGLSSYADPGWYTYPPGTQAHSVAGKKS
ncbi:MAG TPA: copper oxidase [Thermoanaerobaculia bacterium]|nr:copper oxidase [Thermoanaerobaculia bacterium]